MELKVWVDGIQRVICGVTDASTCQDVVHALAHATGQTGRFTLVEKWRNSERLLAPTEKPLCVLTKWGEYAGDVHFLMRRSADPKQPGKRQHDPLRSLSPSEAGGKEIKKSLTFSCGSSGSVSSDNSGEVGARNAKNRSRQDLPKGVVRGVPQKPPRDSDSRIERPKHPPSYDEAVSRSSGRFPTSHLSLASPEAARTRPKPQLIIEQGPERAGKSPEKSPDELARMRSPGKLDGGDAVALARKVEDSNRDPQYQDLLRLVSLQREKLDNQQSEITQFDAEIVYWEGRLQEQEARLGALQEEAARLERSQQEQEAELTQLERRAFAEDLDLGRQEERTLRSELTLARSQLANCETELLQCRQRARLLLEEMAEERRAQEQRREEQERLLQETQSQLQEKTHETETQQTEFEATREELSKLEGGAEERRREVARLSEEIRQANLHALALVPAEEGLTEGSFHNRPGSTRKIIGSPRQLENAVPTNKNPHGVWV